MNAARTAYRYLTVILAADVVVQFFLAGAGVFRADGGKASDSSAFDPHRANGMAFQILALLLFIAAAVGQRNRRNLAGLLFGLSVVQGFLAISGWAGGLHPVVAASGSPGSWAGWRTTRGGDGPPRRTPAPARLAERAAPGGARQETRCRAKPGVERTRRSLVMHIASLQVPA